MPKATPAVRSQKASARAHATVQALIDGPSLPRSIDEPEPSVDFIQIGDKQSQPEVVMTTTEEPPLPETATATTEPQEPENEPLSTEEYPPEKPRGRPRKNHQVIETYKQPDEDFLDYIARAITPNDWSCPQLSGLYGYKIQSGGNLPLFKGVRRPITLEEIKDYAIKHGPGNYRVQLTHKLPHLTSPCGEVFSFDAESLPRNAGQRAGTTPSEATAFSKMAEASANMLEHSAKTAIDLQKDIRIEQGKQPDFAGMFSAMASVFANLIPKPAPPDNTMIQFLITDAQRRADAAEKDAERREARAKEESDRRERDAQRRADEAKAEADRQRERDKEFFGLMLKQAESKADSLNQMTVLLTSFMKVKETIDDTMGGGPKTAWDVAGTVLDGIIQQGPAIVAAVKGATPQQVQQIQQQANPEAAPQPPTPQTQFRELVVRIAAYCRRDVERWDAEYIGQVIQEEYGGLAVELFENEPKEEIVKAFQLTPPGDIILAHASGPEFIGKLIDFFKQDQEEPEGEQEPEVIHSTARKVNGRARAKAS